MIPFMFIASLLIGICAPIGLMFMECGWWDSVKIILSLISVIDIVVLTILISIMGWVGNRVKNWLY
jgi:hypothetical protein